MIYAIGHDIVEKERIKEMLFKYAEVALGKILTFKEQAALAMRNDKVRFVANRFAAKEAFAKACGTGLRAPVLLSNISVLNDELGKPYFVLAPVLENWLRKRGIGNCHLSLSDEKNLSSAIVILEKYCGHES